MTRLEQHHDHDRDSAERHPKTALGEVLKEFEEAETRHVPGPRRESPHDSEAGDGLTPNEGAQEESGRS
ncbi:hypothetical protein [Streptomyces sp. NPDC056670]|uniref:hypothetical protein n=1 Tax=Streptomyces sp. NPDC056670 TaxID=3345904 RepID=UPI0036CE5F0A